MSYFRNEDQTGLWAVLLVLLLAICTMAAFSGCSTTGTKAEVITLPVSCEECQKYNADLKGQPDLLSVCVCK